MATPDTARPGRLARFRAWLDRPVSPRANLILASSMLVLFGAFFAGLTAWLASYGLLGWSVALTVWLCVALGIAGGLICFQPGKGSGGG